ncbi:hypothetical protein N1851_026745 [Merluccius polli]|uniref:Ig-like domain-containing protein n=1 Tax=Merluccius polli TaxID=89951 RepID=A0AA47MBJ6_MERPO|nr:hypothetical protein N1851_026745 [Merluccius polli]
MLSSPTGPTNFSIPDTLYTGNRLVLTCGPPQGSVSIGELSRVDWRLDGKTIQSNSHFDISSSSSSSQLTISRLLSSDRGDYKCMLVGQLLNFIQWGALTTEILLPAPVLSVPLLLNFHCEEETTASLLCCVQTLYTPEWLSQPSSNVLLPSAITMSKTS